MPIELIVNAFVPVLGLLGLGYGSRRAHLLEEGFWGQAEKLTYFVLMPALILANLAKPDAGNPPTLDVAIAVWTGLGSGVAALIVLRRAIHMSPDAFTSVVQGGVRFNTYIGLALVWSLFGAEGMTVAAVAIGVMILTINVICVTAFAICVPNGRLSVWTFVRELARNPLLLACVAGWSLKAAGLSLPASLFGFAEALGKAALPLGVMAVGAALARVEARLPTFQQFAAAGIVKFIVVPGAVLLASFALGLPALAQAVVVLLNAMPTAPSAYILARQLGGDHSLMASLITTQTLFACVILPLAVAAGLLAPPVALTAEDDVPAAAIRAQY